MTMNREHALELLTLLAAVALIQWPGQGTPEFAARDALFETETSSFAVHSVNEAKNVMEVAEMPTRLDPVALLQASVPEDWRVQIPVMDRAPRSSLSC